MLVLSWSLERTFQIHQSANIVRKNKQTYRGDFVCIIDDLVYMIETL
jgi:hypothetical protein